MPRPPTLVRVLAIAALTWAGAPEAAACPSPYNGLSCAGGGSSDVCQTVGSAWYCEGDRGGAATLDAEMYAVYEPIAGTWCTGDTYCAFGTDGYGVDFCCEIDPTTLSTTIVAVTLDGTDITTGTGDLLDFEYSTGGVSRYLRNAIGVVLTGIQYGGDGEDKLWGSGSGSVDYDESLFGEDDDDLILRDGGDFIVGGAGEDECYGDNGIDYITAGSANDTVYGGPGGDDIEGNNNADRLHGGPGADDLYGEAGNDTYCSGADADYDRLRESPVGTDDLLWGDSADYEQGGPNGFTGDGCALLGTTDGTCESTLTTAPGFCL